MVWYQELICANDGAFRPAAKPCGWPQIGRIWALPVLPVEAPRGGGGAITYTEDLLGEGSRWAGIVCFRMKEQDA